MTLQFIKQQLCSTVPPFDVTMQIKIEPIGSTSCRELTNMMEESRQENFWFCRRDERETLSGLSSALNMKKYHSDLIWFNLSLSQLKSYFLLKFLPKYSWQATLTPFPLQASVEDVDDHLSLCKVSFFFNRLLISHFMLGRDLPSTREWFTEFLDQRITVFPTQR